MIRYTLAILAVATAAMPASAQYCHVRERVYVAPTHHAQPYYNYDHHYPRRVATLIDYYVAPSYSIAYSPNSSDLQLKLDLANLRNEHLQLKLQFQQLQGQPLQRKDQQEQLKVKPMDDPDPNQVQLGSTGARLQVFGESCAACHGGKSPQGNLALVDGKQLAPLTRSQELEVIHVLATGQTKKGKLMPPGKDNRLKDAAAFAALIDPSPQK